MVRIFGCGDDLVEIENSKYEFDEIGAFESTTRIRFDDGTVIRVGYSKPGKGIWWIVLEKKGTAESALTVCDDEDTAIYSDVFEIDAEIVGHELLPEGE